MRIKLILVATAVAALAVGVVSSNAALQTSTSVNVKLAKAGAPATVVTEIKNADNANLVPQRVSAITIASKVAKWNSKAVPQCASDIPSNAKGNNNTAAQIVPACPTKSKVGSGTFTVNTGTVGQPIPAELGTISGIVNVYNYKPGAGQQAALLFEIKSDVPVPNAHQYQLATITKAGVLSAQVPNTTDLPLVVQQFLTGRTTSLNNLKVTIKSPKPAKGKKPFLTLKNTKNLDFVVTLDRDNG